MGRMEMHREEVTKTFSKISPYFNRLTLCGWHRRGETEGKEVSCACLYPIRDINPKETGLDITYNNLKIPNGYVVTINETTWKFSQTIEDSFGGLILALTGNVMFTIILRKYAKDLGYRLNHNGLMAGSDIIAGRTEQQIFFMLGLEYVKPINRNVGKGYKLIKKEEK